MPTSAKMPIVIYNSIMDIQLIQPILNSSQIAPPAVAVSPFVRKTARKTNIGKSNISELDRSTAVRETFTDSQSSTYAPEKNSIHHRDEPLEHIDTFA
ncbi:MAG: hypothetical protein HQM07_05075 [Zetaproteobacteria bacterium]|nr:hypothetical protein [Zetaproteobacteria bacterium]